jgi:hypothetical protein
MRLLNILSGLAVLLTTAAFAYLLHQFYTHAAAAGDVHNPLFLTGVSVGIVVGFFSFIGACLLLRRGR